VDLKRGVVPPAANLIEMDNYISKFVNKEEGEENNVFV
jgi:hypothetical protein